MAARYLTAFGRVLPYALLLIYFAQLTVFINEIGVERFVRSTDFMPTMTAAQVITEGHGSSLYDLDVQHEVQARILYPYKQLAPGEILPFNHLPLEAFFVVPFMSLSYVGVSLYWTALLAIALGSALYILQRTVPLRRAWLIVVVLYALSYQPLFRAFILGQTSPLVLLGICITYASVQRGGTGGDQWAGLGLVIVALKLQVLPLLLLLVAMEGRWKALLWFGVDLTALIVACMPMLGITWPLQYAGLLLGVA